MCKDLCQNQLFQINYLAQEICSGQTGPAAIFVFFLSRCGTELHPREARADQCNHGVVLGWVSEPQPVTLLGAEGSWHPGAWPVTAQKESSSATSGISRLCSDHRDPTEKQK